MHLPRDACDEPRPFTTPQNEFELGCSPDLPHRPMISRIKMAVTE